MNALVKKITNAPLYPDITIGVHGGVVQWVMGNPFPIRICDYDGEENELPDMDERGQRCAMWFEPSDAERAAQLKARRTGLDAESDC